jgi:hypothetical protein
LSCCEEFCIAQKSIAVLSVTLHPFLPPCLNSFLILCLLDTCWFYLCKIMTTIIIWIAPKSMWLGRINISYFQYCTPGQGFSALPPLLATCLLFLFIRWRFGLHSFSDLSLAIIRCVFEKKNCSFSEYSKLVRLSHHTKRAWTKIIILVMAISANGYLAMFPSFFMLKEIINSMWWLSADYN